MTDLEQAIDRVLADPLSAARAAPRAIGYVGLDLPLDVLLASGMFPCHLPWDANRPQGKSAQWLEKSFAPWSFSILDAWLDGAFDFFEFVVFSRGDDSTQRLYYYVCELQRQGVLAGPRPLIFDIARIERPTSLAHSVKAIRKLAEPLGIDDYALWKGIEAANEQRRLFSAIDAKRNGPGSGYERIVRASLFDNINDDLTSFEHPGVEAAGKILLAGSAPPDDRIHRAVEANGWTVVGEFHDRRLARLGPEIDIDDGDPAENIGAHAHGLAIGPRISGNQTEALLKEVKRTGADAVILWLIEQDEARLWQVPGQQAALEAAKVPALVLTRRRWDAADGTADEIADFVGGLTA